MRGHRRAHQVQRPVNADTVRAHGTRIRRTAEGLGDEQLASVAKGEPERRGALRRLRLRRSEQAILIHRVRHDEVRRFLRHNQDPAVRPELHLRRTGSRSAQRPRRSHERGQLTVRSQPEPAHVVAPGVEHVDQIAMNRDAHRPCPARWGFVNQAQPVVIGGEERDVVAAGVHGE